MTSNADALFAPVNSLHARTRSLSSSPGLITRPRLLKLLDQYATSPTTLVLAPTGYGKSTLVARWAVRCEHPVAWVSLSPVANSFSTFVALIADAIATLGAKSDIDDPMSLDIVVGRLRQLVSSGQRLTLVFDDYHVVDNRDVHDVMDGLLAQLPDRVGIVIVSRTQPPFALGRLRAQGRVKELTQQDLGFTAEEVAALALENNSGNLSSTQIRDLQDRTEGWIAGIRLALISHEHADPKVTPSPLDARIVQNWLDDYIVEEVLNQLPSDVRDFVLRTAILTKLDPALCNAVLDIDQSSALIDIIRRRLVFVRSDGPASGVVVYHGLFADSVNRIAGRQLGQAELLRLHRRAAEWFESQGQQNSAIDHAVVAEDWEIAVRCAHFVGRDLMDGDHHHSRLHLLSRLPEEVVLSDPHLARWYISAFSFTGQLRRARQLYDQVESRWMASNDPVQLGYVASCCALFAMFSGQNDLAQRFVHEALHHYPLDCHVERLHLWNAVTLYEFFQGHDDIADHAHSQAKIARDHLPSKQRWWTLELKVEQANRRAMRGDLVTAERMYKEYLERLPAEYRAHEAKFRYRLASIYLEQDDIDRAVSEIELVEQDLETYAHQFWFPEALLVAAAVFVAAGDEARHDMALNRVREMHENFGAKTVNDRLEAMVVVAWLRSGQVDRARAWGALKRLGDFHSPNAFGDVDARLAVIQVNLATGDPTRAADNARILIDQATTSKRWADLVLLYVWNAVAQQELGNEDDAVDSLRDALKLGRRGGFVRSFQTSGHDLTPLFAKVRHLLTGEEADWLDRLAGESPVSEIPEAQPQADAFSVAWPEAPLSQREIDVLQLLEHGYTNADIADRLYFSLSSAKKHVSSILRKLGVPNRTAAMRWIREARRSSPEDFPFDS